MAQPINPLDQPLASANKYYKSSQASVIDKSVGNPRGKRPRPAVTPDYVNPQKSRQADMLRSADVYYAATGSLQPMLGSTLPATESGMIQVVNRGDLSQAMSQAVVLLRDGAAARVALLDRTWLPAARLLLEQAVTREEITEDQSRDVVFGLLNLPAAPAAAPEPESVSAVEPELEFATATPVADASEILAAVECPVPVPPSDLPPEITEPAIPIDDPAGFDDDSDSDDSAALAAPLSVAPPKEDPLPSPIQEEAVDSGKRQRRRKDTT